MNKRQLIGGCFVVVALFVLPVLSGCASDKGAAANGGYVEAGPDAKPAKKGGKPGVAAGE